MKRIQEMLQSHPQPANADKNVLAETVSALHSCVADCTSCADACLAEEMVADLRHCIRLNLDCGDICHATAGLLTRQTEPDWSVIRDQLRACATACRACGAECRRHAKMHEHCRICAESCRQCEEACNRMLEAIPAGTMA